MYLRLSFGKQNAYGNLNLMQIWMRPRRFFGCLLIVFRYDVLAFEKKPLYTNITVRLHEVDPEGDQNEDI